MNRIIRVELHLLQKQVESLQAELAQATAREAQHVRIIEEFKRIATAEQMRAYWQFCIGEP
jgi:hypothetical protein